MADAVDYAGWAFKQGSKIKNWKKRFFVLRGRELSYYATQNINGRGEDEKGRVMVVAVECAQVDGKARETMLLITCERKSTLLKIKPMVAEEVRMWQLKLESAIAGKSINTMDSYRMNNPVSRSNNALYGNAAPRYNDDDTMAKKQPPQQRPMEAVQAYYNSKAPHSAANESLEDADRQLAASSLAMDMDDNDFDSDDNHEESKRSRKQQLRGDARGAPPQTHGMPSQSRHGAVSREGWVYVGNPQERQSWKKRYGVLTGPSFTYFASKGSNQPFETVRIRSISLSSSRSNALDLVLGAGGRVMGLAVDTREDLMAWERSIATVLGTPVLLRAASSRGGGDNDFLDGDSLDDANLGGRPSSYAPGVFCEGWLLVKQGFGKNDWTRRYFVLNGATLQQRVTPTSQPTDSSYVVHMTVKNDASVPEFEVEFMSGRSLWLRAENTIDAEQWIHALSDLVGTPDVQTAASTATASNLMDLPQPPIVVRPTVPSPPAAQPIPVSHNKTGWLLKEGKMIKSWKRRFFVLEGDTLQYFDKASGGLPLGSGVVFRVVRNTSPANSLDVHFLNGRILRLSAKQKFEMDDWFDALQFAAELSVQQDHKVGAYISNADVGDDSQKNQQHGWLLKRGQLLKTWKRRYFTLQRNRLMYYDAVGGDLLGAGVVFDVSVGDQRPLCLDVRFQNGRLLHVVASDDQDFQQWHHAMKTASEISESFLSQHSLSQDDAAVFEKEFDFDIHDEDAEAEDDGFPFDFEDDDQEGEPDSGSGAGLWEAAMNNTPEDDRESSWDSDASETNNDDMVESDSESKELRRKGSDASSVPEETRGCSGWLRKEGGSVKNWKRRYFTLHGITLKYFKSASGSLLRSCEITQVDELTSVKFGFAITLANNRRLVVAADSTEEYEKWLLTIWGALADNRAMTSSAGGGDQLLGVISIKSVPSSPVGTPAPLKSHSGWLEKEGRRFKTWKKRYFTLKNGAIMYFNDVGGVAQGHGTVAGVEVDKTKPNTLRISLGTDRVMRVTAATPAEMKTWYQVLAASQKSGSSSYDSSEYGGDADFSEVDSNGSSAVGDRRSLTGPVTASSPAGVSCEPPPQQQQPEENRSRFDAGDYLANDTITNDSFLRIRGGEAELSLTNGSFHAPRPFKGDLAPDDDAEDTQVVRLESDDDLEYLRASAATEADWKLREALRKKKEDEEPVLMIPDQCTACCIVM